MAPKAALRLRALLLAVVFVAGGSLSLLDAALYHGHGRGALAGAELQVDGEGGSSAHSRDCPLAWKSASARAVLGTAPVVRIPLLVERAAAATAPSAVIPLFLASIPESRAPPFPS